jgi:hypothetical protein
LDHAVHHRALPIGGVNSCQIFLRQGAGGELARIHPLLKVGDRQLVEFGWRDVRSRWRGWPHHASTCQSRQDGGTDSSEQTGLQETAALRIRTVGEKNFLWAQGHFSSERNGIIGDERAKNRQGTGRAPQRQEIGVFVVAADVPQASRMVIPPGPMSWITSVSAAHHCTRGCVTKQ